MTVKSHWRWVRKKAKPKRRGRRPPKGRYIVVTDGAGHSCGHHHRTMSGAVACRRKRDAAERNLRARYGRAHIRRHWALEWKG